MTLGTTRGSHYHLATNLNFEVMAARPVVNVAITYEIDAIEIVNGPTCSFSEASLLD